MKKSLKKLSIILASALVLTSLPVDSFGSEPVQEEAVFETVNEEAPKEETAAEEAKEEAEAPAEIAEEPAAEEPSKEEESPAPEESPVLEESPQEEKAVTEEPVTEENPVEENSVTEEKPAADESPATEEPAAANEGAQSNPAATEESVVQEGSSDDIAWENEVDLSSESDDEDEERKKKDDEEESSEDEAYADEEASDDNTEGPAPIFDPGNIDMDMDFSDETVAVLASATQLRAEENKTEGEVSLESVDVLDSSYYGSMENYVTAPKDQGNTKWCWAYAAASMAETSIIKNGIMSKEQLSEKPVNPAHIVYTTYNPERYDYYGETWYKLNDASEFEPGRLNQSSYGINYKRWDYTSFVKVTTDVNSSTPNPAYAVPLKYNDDGMKYARGNLISTVFNFERWAAPSTGDVFDFEGNNDTINAQLRNAYWVPNNDIDSIKAMIRDYGSAGIQIRVDVSGNAVLKKDAVSGVVPYSDYFKYTPIYNGYSANDTVVLVAWDDNIDKNCFTSNGNTPKRNGGFLVKNSYLASLGYGLFWISYEDAAFSLYNGKYKYAVAYDFVPSIDSDFTYGYDGTNHFGSYYTKKVYGIFKSNHSGESASGKVEMLKSIGVGLQDAGKYQLTIYSGYDPSAAKGNQYLTQFEVMTQTVEFNYPGYHTIDLDEPILFYKNDVISVSLEKYDSTNFNMLVDGFIGDYGDWKSKNKTYSEGYSGSADVLYEDIMEAEDGNKYGIMYNSFTHGERENVECYFATAGDSTNIVSGNKVPASGASGKYLRICPRMRLYTSNIKVPKNIDQTMLDIKLKKYIWTRTGNNINPWPEVMIDFDKTEAGIPKDKGGREYPKGVVMYNRKEETVNKEKKITEFHYKLSYANNKENGIAACIVRGTGDIFSGEISIPFKIVEDQLRISRCKFLGLEDQDYKEIKAGKTLNSTYEEIKNNLIIKYYVAETKHYVTLTEGVDYKIGSIEGTNEPGKKLTVMITGIGTFKNTTKPTFKIRKATANKPISDATIGIDLSYEHDGIIERWKEGELPEVDYTGKKIKLNIDSVYDSETGRQLQPGVDYKAKIKYKNNKSAGMASIVLTAEKGSGYSGKITRYFLITPMHVTTDATVKFTKIYKYTGDPIEAKPTVKLYGKKMSQKDLYVSYVNNVGSSTGEATGTGIVFGKGRYTGYIGYSTFTIKPATSS